MKPDEFKFRVNAVVEEMEAGFENFDAALREERRRYWLAFVDPFDKRVEEETERHNRKGMNPYTSRIGGGLMAIGELMKIDSKSFLSGYGLSKLGYDISKGTDLVIRVSPEEGIAMLESFEILELPEGRWGKQDAEGRLFFTPAEFKSRMQELRRYIRGMEEPWPLPVEIKQAATTTLEPTQNQN